MESLINKRLCALPVYSACDCELSHRSNEDALITHAVSQSFVALYRSHSKELGSAVQSIETGQRAVHGESLDVWLRDGAHCWIFHKDPKQTTPMTATRSFFDLLASKGWSPPVKPMNTVEMAEPSRPTVLKKKANSMLDLFAHDSSRPTRATSCTADHASLAKTTSSDANHHQPEQQSTTSKPTKQLKKCASVGAKTFGGWGMIPVLNELEQHSSFYHRPTRRRRASQCMCRNCGRLFFKHLSGVEADFCSLDCQASHAYASDVQDAIDAQLEISGSSDSLETSDWSSASASSYSSSSVMSFSSGS